MTWPPSLARIRIVESGRKKLGLWLPLLLVWPVAVLVWLTLLPAIVLLAALLWPRGKGKLVLLGGPRAFWVFCALRGLSVHADDGDSSVSVDFW